MLNKHSRAHACVYVCVCSYLVIKIYNVYTICSALVDGTVATLFR